MSLLHVFVETNFLFAAFQLPSKRQREALALRSRFELGEVKLYLPYLCLQEAKHTIGKRLSDSGRYCDDLQEFDRFAVEHGEATWNADDVRKLLVAARAEIDRTKAVYRNELKNFANSLHDGLLHGTDEVFDFVEALDLDSDLKKFNDKLILCSVLVKAKHLASAGETQLFFATMDKHDLQPTPERPRMTRYYREAGLTFVPRFKLPEV